MPCSPNFNITLPECTDFIDVYAGLTANTSYTYFVYGDSRTVFNQTITTDAEGSFIIASALFPDRYFNPYEGAYVLEVIDSNGNSVEMVFREELYSKVVMRFVKSDNPIAVIK